MTDARPGPRPRPRPRPVQKSATSSSPNATAELSKTGSSSATTIPLSSPNGAAKRVIVVEDTDEMFMRNRNRSSKTWQKLEQIDKAAVTREASDESEDEEQENVSPRTRKRAKKETGNVVPVWRKSQALARMLSQEIPVSSDDDDGFELTGTSTPNGKRKRMRSRSRSITPPPALQAHQIQNAKRVVRQTLEAVVPAIRPPSPTIIDLDDSTDTISLQPEFMELVRRVRDESQRGMSQELEAVPGEELLLTVRWQPHPLDPNGKEEEWQYKVDKTDNFRDLFEAVAEDALVPQANVILTYLGKRFFPSVTPHTLKIWSDTAEFHAFEKTAYEYTNQPKPVFPPISTYHTAGVTSIESIDLCSDDDEDTAAGAGADFRTTLPLHASQTQESDAESEDLGEKMRLVLRSAMTGSKTVTLVVRPTTKCGAIVKAFLKKLGLEEKYPEVFGNSGEVVVKGKGKKGRKSIGGVSVSKKDPRLSIDGDKMDNDIPIGQADLEDGDMVEVVGL